jgi:hypothetical protein
MRFPLKTTLAILALGLCAGAAQAAPAPALDTSLLVKIADDSTSETQAIEDDRNTEPSSGGSMTTEPDPSAGDSMSSKPAAPRENKEYDRENDQ